MIKRVLLCISILLYAVILLDFVLPGQLQTDTVVSVDANREQYYNAAGNYHYSYKVKGEQHNVSVSEDFAEKVEKGHEFVVNVSPVFKVYNSIEIAAINEKETYSLRVYAGLIVPLLGMLVMLLGFRYREKLSILIFVFHVLFVFDSLYLLY